MAAALSSRDNTLLLLKENLKVARDRMKTYVDLHRTEREFQVGDFVYLQIQPYRQISIAQRRPHKLSPKFYGPYKVLARVGSLAYKLELPSEALLHPVFHVSQLKKHLSSRAQVQSDIPQQGEAIIKEPDWILQRRLVQRRGKAAVDLLIQWKEGDADTATWVPYESFVKEYPSFDLETRSK